jgi:hypothetical protein
LKIRPFEASDLHVVADLYARVIRGEAKASPALVADLENLLLKCPSLPDLPSLVAEDGAIVGFLGVHARTFLFDGAPIRLAAGAQLVTEPQSRRHAPGLLLLRQFLAGPQDLSVADGANAAVRKIWEALGGETYHLGCARWTRLISPFRFVGTVLGRRRGAFARAARWALPLWAALDLAGRRLPMARARPPERGGEPVPLTPGLFAAELPRLARGLRLRPDYSKAFAEWLFAALAAVRVRGTFHAWAVPGESGPLGWFLYYMSADGIASTMHVFAAPGLEECVFDHLVEHARRHGARAVQGRLDPVALACAERHKLIFQYPDASLTLLHAKRSEITHSIHTGQGLLTRIDAEYWMAPHLERYD